MSFAAEPYALFVEDILANLTGGESRVRFRFVEEELPFRLSEHDRARPESLRVTGLVDGTFTRFDTERDVRLLKDGTLQWQENSPGVPAAGARWPDAGTDVWVGFDRLPGGPAPLLNDRNPGSVVSVLAGSFAREFAVLSRQLELVYQGAFVDTATGRDLDQVAALVGVERRGALIATGEVVFHRPSPLPADVTIVAGTLVSTANAPQVTVETNETVTLRRGTVSVAAPVSALASGPTGVAPARSLTVIHRPIFGVDDVLNPEPLHFGGGGETDDALRARVKRAFETSGRSTVGALKGALGALDKIREQDVYIEEDHLSFPGVVKVTVSADVDSTTAILASRALEEHRPAGVRIIHNLPAPTTPLPSLATDTGGGGDGPGPSINLAGVFVPLSARIVVTPADAQLVPAQKDQLQTAVEAAFRTAVDDTGVGDPIIYNRLVAAIMAVAGVLDAVLEIGVKPDPPAVAELARYNIRPVRPGTRPTLGDGDLTVQIRGERVVLDLTVAVERRGLAASGDAATVLAAARAEIEGRLVEAMLVTPAQLSPAVLLGLLPPTDDYAVEQVSYRVELLDEGVRVARQDVVVPLDEGQIVWIRSVAVTEATVSG